MTDSAGTIVVPWADWLRQRDVQHVYIKNRERVFEVMFSFLDALLPPQITMLDLAASAGSISHRLLRLRPEARSVVVDIDPVMLTIGKGAVATWRAGCAGRAPICWTRGGRGRWASPSDDVGCGSVQLRPCLLSLGGVDISLFTGYYRLLPIPGTDVVLRWRSRSREEVCMSAIRIRRFSRVEMVPSADVCRLIPGGSTGAV